jgi:AraC family transcriptional regulator
MRAGRRARVEPAVDHLSSPSASRAEYLARIHRVIDHIERHLADPLPIEGLAAVACFSPYHFHRLFTAHTGEPLYRFILRLRVERAANQLLHNPGKSVTAIAFDCGFGSSAAFARAFRAAFGTSATAFRAACRKNRETIRKMGQDRIETRFYDPSNIAAIVADDVQRKVEAMSTTSARTEKAAQSVRIETIEPMPVAYVRHIGPYAGDSALFGRLFGRLSQWVGARGLFGPGTKWLTIYHDNPEVTEPERLRISPAPRPREMWA